MDRNFFSSLPATQVVNCCIIDASRGQNLYLFSCCYSLFTFKDDSEPGRR